MQHRHSEYAEKPLATSEKGGLIFVSAVTNNNHYTPANISAKKKSPGLPPKDHISKRPSHHNCLLLIFHS